MSRESFILQLRTMIGVLETIRNTLTPEIEKLQDVVKQLQDESHLGSHSAFDYGLKDQAGAVKRIKKELTKAQKEIKNLSGNLEDLQTKQIAEDSTQMTDLPDKT